MSTMIAYAFPTPTASLEAQVARLRPLVGGNDRLIQMDQGNSRRRRDAIILALSRTQPLHRPGKILVVSLDVLGDSRGDIVEMLRLFTTLGVALESLDDDIAGLPTETEYALKVLTALDQAEAAIARRPRPAVGRPVSLTDEDVVLLLRLRDEEHLTWPAIHQVFRDRGRAVGQSTLRRDYALAKAEIQERQAAAADNDTDTEET